MKNFVRTLLCSLLLLAPCLSHAIYNEIGLSYGRKKTTFDANNNYDSESATASWSLYFAEQVALELSYTEATGISKQQATPVDLVRVIYQKTQIAGADLILILADRKAMFQPFLKGGMAYLVRKQEIKDGTMETQTLPIDVAYVPNYGLGMKVELTESFGLKIAYSVWQTPIGGGAKTNDDSLSAGVTWRF
jgi:hypothetical protein